MAEAKCEEVASCLGLKPLNTEITEKKNKKPLRNLYALCVKNA